MHKLKLKEQVSYQVPTINLSNYETDSSCLKYGLHHSFIDKIRFIKRGLGIELESLAANVDEFVSLEVNKECNQLHRNSK